jgi:signal transduction histidine kinase
VKQYLDVLLYTSREQLPERAIEWITRSQARLGEMLTIIQDWLALAKIDRGALCDTDAASDIVQVVDRVIKEQQHIPGAQAVSLTTSFSPHLPPVCGDAVSLGMLVGNLISNAFKYNRPGGTVSVKVDSDGEWIYLEVLDSGIGIPKECMPRLFEEFYRANRPETENIPGTGLGLIICRKIADELGGGVDVDSEEGRFTRFTVRLPAAKSTMESKAFTDEKHASRQSHEGNAW